MHASLTQWVPAPRSAPDGMVVFAVGDIHGHCEELLGMQRLIRSLIASGEPRRALIVYLGDYIDRGPASGRVLDLLASEPTQEAGIERVFLAGNHDQYLIELLKCDEALDRPFMTFWYDNGGEATMQDLGVEGYGRLVVSGDFRELSGRTRHALGERRVAFLERLVAVHRAGDYVFAHAGIDPDRDLDDQDFCDLLLVREPFLSARSGWRHPFCVVHGHSIALPEVRPHRIGADAGCYVHGALCAVQIEDRRVRFLGVSRDADFAWQTLLGRDGYWSWTQPVLLR